MSSERHGISVGLERFGSEFFLVFKAVGKLTYEDYQAIAPVLESALAGVKGQHVKVLVDISEFSGWELRAAWDDFQLGLKIGPKFEKVAIYGDKHWQELASKVGGWFISGEMQSFNEYDSAIKWLEG
ncbi:MULTISPECIES: STAS/SEC14 domain-containing protein [Vibrio]|uniref:STAS/SEC14 domain-containing protein n=1 Tax=Vibrio alginolyticus TaxID=663 RepID=A0A7Y4F1X1_VIBAL|nr:MULTISPECIES: STAS/SEC14 domain-containing protein [Vibrio]AVF65851.1 STAS/SEC14 domain-containing protein [Vibrio alginolyticus]EJL6727318.1 STAS/SEC14 domain-containing protein [Vibrio alginolyticus]ELN6885385.1 STAS/SEC14 domain-containing protein [Vibrio alginolyticus]MBO0211701.1 STAS/SEC14 domain-containing protein [Vibrio sp. Vb0877]MBS9814908.1 STAS/SEC14 domain-containing protein [Vibrio alginolyticus]